MISVIISVFNEMNNPYLPKILKQFKDDILFELICVDGGSTDGTIEWLKAKQINVQVLLGSTRAARLNLGMAQARGETMLLQHPRSCISDDGIVYLKQSNTYPNWAAFTHCFDDAHVFLRFISWYSNAVRVKKKSVVYLDHCILLKKNLMPQIPDIEIFEDTVLSHQLRLQDKPVLLPYQVTTSAIRFLDRGVYKQFILNQAIKLLYTLRFNPRLINWLYERKLNLNQKN